MTIDDFRFELDPLIDEAEEHIERCRSALDLAIAERRAIEAEITLMRIRIERLRRECASVAADVRRAMAGAASAGLVADLEKRRERFHAALGRGELAIETQGFRRTKAESSEEVRRRELHDAEQALRDLQRLRARREATHRRDVARQIEEEREAESLEAFNQRRRMIG